MSHLCDWLAFVHPCYRFFTLVTVGNGIIALLGASLLPFVIHVVMKMPTPEEYNQALRARHDSDERERTIRDGQREWVIHLFRKVAKIQDRVNEFEKLPGMHDAVAAIRTEMNALIADCRSGGGTSREGDSC